MPFHPFFSYGLGLFALCAVYALIARVTFTYRLRRRFTDIVSLPRHWLWGNLVNCGVRLSPALNRHPDYGFEEIWHELKEPPAFLVDLAPIDRAFLVTADPTVTEAIVQPSPQLKYSAPKSETLSSMHRLIGWDSLIIAEGEEWKGLRRRFNKGFSPAHIHSLSPLIITKTRVFLDRLKAAAESHEVFALKEYAQDLTTDIITELTIETDFHAQSTPEGQGAKSTFGLLTASRILSSLVFKTGQGFNPIGYFDPIRPTKAWLYEKIFDHQLAAIITQQLQADRKSQGKEKPAIKSITRLALSGMEPTPALIRSTVAQVKSFLFAGQDTTATLVQWMCYELSKASFSPHHAAIYRKLVAEHDSVFGSSNTTTTKTTSSAASPNKKNPHPFSALDLLAQPSQAEQILGDKLPYTTAFIKEVLRLHPPAATARQIPDFVSSSLNSTPSPNTVKVPIAGHPTAINGLRVYACQWLIHRNKAIWGADAHEFRPDRWLDDTYMASLPAGAWRPFERGPRNCIGQELAMMEGKVVLVAVARAFAFEKIGLTGRRRGESDDDDDVEKEKEVWSVHTVTSVPVDGMRMRVRMR